MNRIVAEGDASADVATELKKAAKKAKPNELIMEKKVIKGLDLFFLTLLDVVRACMRRTKHHPNPAVVACTRGRNLSGCA